MARLNALSLLQEDGVTPLLLQELYGNIIEGVEATAVSMLFKNRDLSGDFASGTVEAKRFVNGASNAYGTARAAGAGVAVKAEPVTVKRDTNKEIIEEIEEKDLHEAGIRNLFALRERNHVMSMAYELDIAFFRKAYTTGTEFTPSVGATTWIAKIEEQVVAMEKTKNDYVRGVPRFMIQVAVKPEVYSAIRQELSPIPASENSWARGEIGLLNDIRIVKSVNLPSGLAQVVDAVCMVDGSIAQPVHVVPCPLEKVQLSKAYAAGLFYDFGTEAVMPDLISYIGDTYVA